MPKRKKNTTAKNVTKTTSKIDSDNSEEEKIKPEVKEEKKTPRKSTTRKRATTKKKNQIKKYDETYISTISDEEKIRIQKITEELRNKNLGIYDFEKMVCRIHEIPLRKYKTLEDQEKEPYAKHCPKCVPIPENWQLIQ